MIRDNVVSDDVMITSLCNFALFIYCMFFVHTCEMTEEKEGNDLQRNVFVSDAVLNVKNI